VKDIGTKFIGESGVGILEGYSEQIREIINGVGIFKLR